MRTFKLYHLPLFLFCFPVFGQIKLWEKQISNYSSNRHLRAEYRDFDTGPDGKIYSVGFFRGNRAPFGNMMVFSDSSFIKPSPTILPDFIENSFISCQSTSGNFEWVKVLNFDLGRSDISAPNGFLATNYANKIVVAPDQSIYCLGMGSGDSLSFQGNRQLALGNSGTKPQFFVLKLNQNGVFQWIKVFGIDENAPPGMSDIDPSFISLAGAEVQVVVAHTPGLKLGSTILQNKGQTLIRMDASGNVLGNQQYSFPTNLLNDVEVPVLTRKLPDGKWIIGHQAGAMTGLKNSYLTILNPDFTFNIQIKIGALDANGQPAVAWPLDFFRLTSTQNGAFVAISNASTILFGGDTLSIPPGAKSLFIKLTDFACMKKVEALDNYPMAQNAVSTEGNVFTNGPVSYPGFGGFPADTGLSQFRQYNRNGNAISTLEIQKHSLVSGNNWIVEGIPPSFYKTKLNSNELLIMQGHTLTKIQIQDPVVSDLSFSACLSNRAIILSNSGLQQKREWFALKMKEHEISIELQEEGNGTMALFDTKGKTLIKGVLQKGENRFTTYGIPQGIYVLRMSNTNSVKTSKILLR